MEGAGMPARMHNAFNAVKKVIEKLLNKERSQASYRVCDLSLYPQTGYFQLSAGSKVTSRRANKAAKLSKVAVYSVPSAA